MECEWKKGVDCLQFQCAWWQGVNDEGRAIAWLCTKALNGQRIKLDSAAWCIWFPVLQYGGAPGGPAFPGQTQDPLYGYFAAVAGQVSFPLNIKELWESASVLAFVIAQKNALASGKESFCLCKRERRKCIVGFLFLNIKNKLGQSVTPIYFKSKTKLVIELGSDWIKRGI